MELLYNELTMQNVILKNTLSFIFYYTTIYIYIYQFIGYIKADSNIEILSILKHYFKMRHKAAEARKIREIEGHDRPAIVQIF